MDMHGVRPGDLFELNNCSQNGERVVLIATNKKRDSEEWRFIVFWIVTTIGGSSHASMGDTLNLEAEDLHKIAYKIKNVLS